VRIRSLVSLAAIAMSAGQLFAQNSPQMSPAAAVPQWRSFIGANPLGIPFDIVAIEAETSIGSAATLGLVGSYNDFDSQRFLTADVRGKYYPGEVAMRGFAIGLSVGVTKFNAEDFSGPYNPTTNEYPRNTLKAPTLGVLVDYNWAQGPSQRFVVGTGVGAKRILASRESRQLLDLPRAYPTGRIVIGLLF
jgi:hypothetical protein